MWGSHYTIHRTYFFLIKELIFKTIKQNNSRCGSNIYKSILKLRRVFSVRKNEIYIKTLFELTILVWCLPHFNVYIFTSHFDYEKETRINISFHVLGFFLLTNAEVSHVKIIKWRCLNVHHYWEIYWFIKNYLYFLFGVTAVVQRVRVFA